MATGSRLFLAVTTLASLHAIEFVPNLGQFPGSIQFAGRSGGVEVHATNSGDIALRSRAAGAAAPVTIVWRGAKAGDWAAQDPTGKQVKYCTNGAPAQACAEGISTFASVRRRELYPGVDLVLHGAAGEFEYDLEVQAKGAWEEIRFAIQGGATPELDASGKIHAGDLVQWRPVAYQRIAGRRVAVPCAVKRHSERTFGFVIFGEYRKDLPLVIDPVVESGLVIQGDRPGEERVVGRAGGYIFGLSKRIGAGDWDVFVRYGSLTTYWGGDGDEEIAGYDSQSGGDALLLAGSTTSRNASAKGIGASAAYQGGATDGYLLEFSRASLTHAALLGGPGADVLHDVHRAPAGLTNFVYVLAGATDDPGWAGFQVEGSARGGMDAVVAVYGTGQRVLAVTGGAGADAAKSIRLMAEGTDSWIVAGETTSVDFAGSLKGGRDIWVAGFSSSPVRWHSPSIWGGAGEDRLAGVAVIAGHGILVAGATTSRDLPTLVTGSEYGGGETDGFVAWLDPLTLAAKRTLYLGGDGADEITGITAWYNDLFLTGFTDSVMVALPGRMPGSDPAGRQDGWFVQTDAFLNPLAWYRAGGSGNDRFTGIEPKATGVADLAGWSESGPWLKALDPLMEQTDRAAGFSLTLRYAMIASPTVDFPRVVPDPPIRELGKDLVLSLPVLANHEPESDLVLIARSSDPAKLRITGGDSILYSKNAEPRYIDVEALAGEGEAEIIISGRHGTASPVPYPERRVPIRLTPSRVSLQAAITQPQYVMRGSEFTIRAVFAQLESDGSMGRPRWVRPGVTGVPTLIASNPDAVALLSQGVDGGTTGGYSFRLRALQEGEVTLELRSDGIQAAPDQRLAVRITATAPPPRLVLPHRPAIMLDHSSLVSFSLLEGDRLRFTSGDPERLQLETDGAPGGGVISFETAGAKTLRMSARQAGAAVGVRVEGVWQGSPVDERMEVLPWPYRFDWRELQGAVIPLGGVRYPSLDIKPQVPLPPGFQLSHQTINPNSSLAQAPIRVADPGVVEVANVTIFNSSIQVELRGIRLGRTTMTTGGTSTPSDAQVEVVPTRISYGKEIWLLAGSKIGIYPEQILLPFASYSRVRVRVSDPGLFELDWLGQKGGALTIDLSQLYALLVEAKGPVGRDGLLYVSAPGMEEIAVPLLVRETILLPRARTQRLALPADNTTLRGELYFDAAAYDPAAIVASGNQARPVQFQAILSRKVRVTTEPSGVCEFPAEATHSHYTLALAFVCREEGRVKVRLQGEGLAADQGKYDTQLIVYRPAAQPPFRGTAVSLAQGTQTRLTPQANGLPFNGTLISSDPDRVRLSTSATQPGRAEVSGAVSQGVYLQALGGEGMVRITAVDGNGNRGEFPVFLYPATMAVRPASDPSVSEVQMAADQGELAVSVSPFAVDPASGLLFNVFPNFAVRAGMDPFFLKTGSSDTAVATPVPPNPLFSETDTTRPAKFKINGKGTAILTAEQPAGFVASPNGALRLTVVERELRLGAMVAAPGLQTHARVTRGPVPGEPRPGSSPSVAITVTSLDPEKMLVSAKPEVLGSVTLNTSTEALFYVQALPAAQPGERLRLRLSGAGFVDSIAEVPVTSAALVWADGNAPRSPFPAGSDTQVSFRYGPVDPLEGGVIDRLWSGGPLPGVQLTLSAQVSDSSVLALANPQFDVSSSGFAVLRMRTREPGTAELLITAPEGIVNRVERTTLRVDTWKFPGPSSSLHGARGLWAPLTIRNPRPEPTTITVQSTGTAALEFGLSLTSTPAPSIRLTVPGLGQSTAYWTATGAGGTAGIGLSAPGFASQSLSVNLYNPAVAFQVASPFSLAVANRTATLSIRLQGQAEQALAGPPMTVEVRSSDPRILRVPTGQVTFQTGQSVANVNVEILSPGTVALTAVPPATFAGPGQSGSGSLTVVVR